MGLNSSINFVIGELAREDISRDEREVFMYKLNDLRQLKRCLVERNGAKLECTTARK